MRKWLLIPAVLLLAIGSVYWFIPAQLTVVQITPVQCPAAAAFRSLAITNNWRQWWPSKKSMQYKDSRFHISKTLLNTFELQIQQSNIVVNSTIHLLSLKIDSTAIQWECTIPSGMDPFTRIRRYQQAAALKNSFTDILAAFRSFAEKNENLYGVAISETAEIDTTLIATKTTMPAYPSTARIYALVQALKQYSAEHGARQTAHPLLNVTPLDSSHFQVMVALPVDKPLPDKGIFFQRHMVPRKFLFTSAHGGDSTIQRTYRQLQLYIQDFHRSAMAIPFQMLVTDRSAEPDTGKWVTHFYVPVF